MNSPLDVSQTLPLKCSACSSPPDPGYKTCTRCRARRNAQSHQAKQRKKDAMQLLAASYAKLNASKPVVLSETLKRKSKDEGDSTPVRKKKRVERILKSYKTANAEPVNMVSKDDNAAMKFGKEYQTASEMYKRLNKLALKSKPVDFEGSYSIVADPAVDNGKRASLVARDIRKIAHFSFNHKAALGPAIQSRTSYSLRFQCTCAPKGDEKSKKHSLAASLNRGKDNAAGGLCQGKVQVMVMEDLRHPMGIVGQQIRVHIHHGHVATA
ncbi:hypothetical protein BT96DRAFT_1011457 [Gymnopus androsaceus JB14]|uniref:Uncharacterized protein n=1 Tax=Gymnopus androsaceus JB14 TaxID=1447944 RepID=A0A6A4IJI4_9AGAR|nr:hypothetical protein BT96DRAFT_1011457 [Gymnopus androsaceus JB14]